MPISKSPWVSGFATIGKINAVIGAIIGSIIMIILLVIGYFKYKDKHTSTALMTITDIISDFSITTNGNTMFTYVVNLAFTLPNGDDIYVSSVNYVTPQNKLSVKEKINMRYDPKNPTSVVQESSPKTTGLILIGIGLTVGALTIGTAVLAFKSQGFAAVTGATDVAASVAKLF